MTDTITIRIPASTAHIGLIRATASGLAARLDFTYDRITDLHIALDELCSRILATSEPPPSRLEVAFELAGDGLRVTAKGDSPLKDGAAFLNPWSKMILESVTDGIDVVEGVAAARVVFRQGAGAPA